MKAVYVNSLNVFSPLGATAGECFDHVMAMHSGVRVHESDEKFDEPFPAAIIDESLFDQKFSGFSRYEQMLMNSVSDALAKTSVDAASPGTLFIFSTTKGNIAELDGGASTEKLLLQSSSEKIARYFGNPNVPVTISNACISGVAALLYAVRMLRSGKYTAAIVAGADSFTKFVHSGFESFQALSPGICKPFSSERDGINLGEAAATMILTTLHGDSNTKSSFRILGGAVTNDSNHISGPSRTGAELGKAIEKALEESEVIPEHISFISAHGTATPFNDEMEAKAFSMAGLEGIPVNSLKGFFGHTLGAAGVVESAISLLALQKDYIPPTFGYTGNPVLPGLRVNSEPLHRTGMQYLLKTASGFGGCNAALVFEKTHH